MATNVTPKDKTLYKIIGWARVRIQVIDVAVKAGTYKRLPGDSRISPVYG